MAYSWREFPEHSTTGFPPIIPESYFMKRELLDRPDPNAGSVSKRPRTGDHPQIHEMISESLAFLQNKNHVQYSQSDDLQVLLNKVNEIEYKLDSVVPKSEKSEEQPSVKQAQVVKNAYKFVLSQIQSMLKEDVTTSLKTGTPQKKEVDDLNTIKHLEELLNKLKHADGNPSLQTQSKTSNRGSGSAPKLPQREKRKLDPICEFEPMTQDFGEMNRRKLTPRKFVFSVCPQNRMDID